MLPSERHTTSFGRLSRLPSKRSISDLRRRELSVCRPAGQPAVAAFADDEPALRVEGRAVALAGILAQQLGLAAGTEPVEAARPDIDKIIEPVRVPERPLGEDEPGREPFGLARFQYLG